MQENIWIVFVTLIYFSTDVYFLCEYFLYLSAINITPFSRVLVIETQSWGHANVYLVKANWEKNWKIKRPFWGDIVLA